MPRDQQQEGLIMPSEQPREGTRVKCALCNGTHFYKQPMAAVHGQSVNTICPYCGPPTNDTDEPAQPQPREGTRVEGCQHDSTRVDGWLDDCCLRCGASGYFKDGHYVDPTGKQTKGHPSGKTLIWPEPAQPEQPREEEARVEKCRCGFPFYEDRFTIPRLDGGSVPDAWEFCPYCGGRLDEPAQPQPRGEGDAGKTRGYTREDIQANTWWPGKGGEGDDLAARLEDWAKQVAWPDPVYTDDMARDLRDAAQLLARASTHPEQSERVDLEWAFRLMRDCLQAGKEPEDDEQDRLDDIADAMIRPAQPEQGGEGEAS